ncbi:hypothetical protein SDC9_192200 [bioreactor metagenome]|uniref:Uncharacterized protein n=1 Tax=bioreactor metagenome TaxID=1076179 RepID=A0A645I019_9ZZZZ
MPGPLVAEQLGEQHLAGRRIGVEGPQQCQDDRTQRLPALQGGPGRRDDRRDPVGGLPHDHGAEALLGAEVVEHRALADPGTFGDVVHRGGTVAALGEQLQSRRDHPFPGRDAAGRTAIGPGAVAGARDGHQIDTSGCRRWIVHTRRRAAAHVLASRLRAITTTR